MKEHLNLLPVGVAPIGFNREQAAFYWGVSPSKFDELRKKKIAPPPRNADGKLVWFRLDLDQRFASLPYKGGEGTSENDGGEW